VKKGFEEIEHAFTGGEDLRKLQYRLPTSLAAQPNELEKIYQGMRAGGATHEDALEALRDPDAMRLFLAGHRLNDQLIAIKLPPEEGMEEDFKLSIREQDTPASQRAFIHLIEDYANFIVQKAKENPFMAQVIIAGMQAVISGPVSAFISVAKDLVLGDTIEDLETKIVQFVSNHLDVPENKVEITENCFKLAFALFLGGKTKAIVQKAEGVVQAVKKLKSKTALNHHKLSNQGKKVMEKTHVQKAKKINVAAEKPLRGAQNPKVREAIRIGREKHKEFKEKVQAKQHKGWVSEEPERSRITGEIVIPDAKLPSGNFLELKPNTPSGRAQGVKQLKKYQQALDKKGRVIYYDPK